MNHYTQIQQKIEHLNEIELIEVIDFIDFLQHKKTHNRTREQLVADVQAARVEFAQGDCEPISVDALMNEILS